MYTAKDVAKLLPVKENYQTLTHSKANRIGEPITETPSTGHLSGSRAWYFANGRFQTRQDFLLENDVVLVAYSEAALYDPSSEAPLPFDQIEQGIDQKVADYLNEQNLTVKGWIDLRPFEQLR